MENDGARFASGSAVASPCHSDTSRSALEDLAVDFVRSTPSAEVKLHAPAVSAASTSNGFHAADDKGVNGCGVGSSGADPSASVSLQTARNQNACSDCCDTMTLVNIGDESDRL